MAKIHIVDDDEEFSSNLAAVLEKHGHSVTASSDHRGVLQHLVDNVPDLLILDVMFPDNPVAGFDLARRVRRSRAHRKLPIILLTGVNQEFPASLTAKDIDKDWMPVQDFIEKTVQPAILIERIRKMLGPDA